MAVVAASASVCVRWAADQVDSAGVFLSHDCAALVVAGTIASSDSTGSFTQLGPRRGALSSLGCGRRFTNRLGNSLRRSSRGSVAAPVTDASHARISLGGISYVSCQFPCRELALVCRGDMDPLAAFRSLVG